MYTFIENSCNKRVFVLDNAETDDTPKYFEKACEYIKTLENINIIEYISPFWYDGVLKFEMDNIYMELWYFDFPAGTYLTSRYRFARI